MVSCHDSKLRSSPVIFSRLVEVLHNGSDGGPTEVVLLFQLCTPVSKLQVAPGRGRVEIMLIILKDKFLHVFYLYVTRQHHTVSKRAYMYIHVVY